MAFTIDFGFETPGAPFERASLALFFASSCGPGELGRVPGAAAVADGSRYVELFEAQVGLSPLDIGAYAEVVGGADPALGAALRADEAIARGVFPIIAADDRRATAGSCRGPLVALWGTVGRTETDEAAIFEDRTSILAGVRAASARAFKAIPGSVAIIPARGLLERHDAFRTAMACIEGKVHLSIDLDVLAPAVAQAPRSVEPGGLSWYELMDAVEMVFEGPGVAAADLVGLAGVAPRSPAALLGAQILLKLAGLVAARSGR
ncbi:MAG: arginase family protein [Deltaproteobacteria bacterium]|nr:arginase family protein [Deltaproteobacteria bacterium]